jgi:hypothetical protein
MLSFSFFFVFMFVPVKTFYLYYSLAALALRRGSASGILVAAKLDCRRPHLNVKHTSCTPTFQSFHSVGPTGS